jgi:hypothetical protein
MQLHNVLAAISAMVASTIAAKVGDAGVLKGLDAGLAGTVTVKDKNTLEISGYTLEDASAPALYWWGANDENLSSGRRINNERVTATASGSTITVALDNGSTADDFSVVGLWCERFAINFGQTALKASDGSSTGGGASTPAAANPTAENSQSPKKDSGAGKGVVASLIPVVAAAIFVASLA